MKKVNHIHRTLSDSDLGALRVVDFLNLSNEVKIVIHSCKNLLKSGDATKLEDALSFANQLHSALVHQMVLRNRVQVCVIVLCICCMIVSVCVIVLLINGSKHCY